jgi:hypothetical protein
MRYSDWLWAGRSGDRIPVGPRFSALVQTSPGAHPASCTMGTEVFSVVKSGRGVMLTPYPLLVPWSWKSRAIPLLPLWAVRPVQSLSACTRVHFTFFILPVSALYGNHQVLKSKCTEQGLIARLILVGGIRSNFNSRIVIQKPQCTPQKSIHKFITSKFLRGKWSH